MSEGPTQRLLDALNARQHDGTRHPLTCGGNRSDDAHRRYADEHEEHDWGILRATATGWVCPVCDYRQAYGPSPGDPEPVDLRDTRISDLEAELARIRPVYEAACRYVDSMRENVSEQALAHSTSWSTSGLPGVVDAARATR